MPMHSVATCAYVPQCTERQMGIPMYCSIRKCTRHCIRLYQIRILLVYERDGHVNMSFSKYVLRLKSILAVVPFLVCGDIGCLCCRVVQVAHCDSLVIKLDGISCTYALMLNELIAIYIFIKYCPLEFLVHTFLCWYVAIIAIPTKEKLTF